MNVAIYRDVDQSRKEPSKSLTFPIRTATRKKIILLAHTACLIFLAIVTAWSSFPIDHMTSAGSTMSHDSGPCRFLPKVELRRERLNPLREAERLHLAEYDERSWRYVVMSHLLCFDALMREV